MKFIKRIFNPTCGLILLSILVVACSSSPKKKDADVAAVAGASILPAGAPTPNPYLQNKSSASRQAIQNFAAATTAMRNKQWGQAETLLQKVIAENNSLSGAHLNLGLVYRAQDDTKRAEQAFNNAIAANSNNLDAYNQLAILKREAGDFAAAEANYQKALSLWVFHPDSHKNIAILYDLYMGKSAEALPHYEAYQQLLGGEDKEAASWIADLQRRLGITPAPKAAPVAETPVATEATEEPASEVTVENGEAVVPEEMTEETPEETPEGEANE